MLADPCGDFMAMSVGCVQLYLINIQARQQNRTGVPIVKILLVSLGISLVWALSVHSVARSWEATPFYAAGAALGSAAAYKVKIKGSGGLN